MTSWANTPTSPTSSEAYAYDGEGHVVARHILNDGTLSDTLYLGAFEQITTTSTGTSTRVFLAWGSGGARWALRTDGTLTYLLRDHLSSVVVGLDTSGNATVSRLYDARGVPRYFSVDGFTDSLLGEEGYGGQPSDDGVSGLGMMGARQYEGDLSQFTSADTVQDGLNRYAYAHDNPETYTDPSGHMIRNCGVNDDFCTGAGGVNSPPPPKTKDCHATNTCGGSPPASTCGSLCQQINANFHDSAMRRILELLTQTDIGRAFLSFILAEAKIIGSGDVFLTFQPGVGGYNYWDGFIALDISLENDPVAAAPVLIHEAVESYFAIVYGIRGQASQHMDYLAQWFAGEFEAQSNQVAKLAEDNGSFLLYAGGFDPGTTLPGQKVPTIFGSYGLSFAQWEPTDDGQSYNFEPTTQDAWQNFFGNQIFAGRLFYWVRTGSRIDPIVPESMAFNSQGFIGPGTGLLDSPGL